MNPRLRVAIADDDRDTREYLRELLARLDCDVVASADNGEDLVRSCERTSPDLIVSDIKMPALDGIEAAVTANRLRPTPVILVSAHHDDEVVVRLKAASIPVLGFLVKPFTEAHLKTALAVALPRFEQMSGAMREAAELRQALEDRKVTERAKGALMRRLGVHEDEAYRRMRVLASNKNLKIVELSRQVLEAETIFTALEGV